MTRPHPSGPEQSTGVRWLGDPASVDVSVFGSKVANLAKMRAAGIPAPDGFAVSANAYLDAVRAAGARDRLAEAVAAMASRPELIDELSLTCRRIIETMRMPAPLQSQVREAYDELALRRTEAYPVVAVRSSALKEDTLDASGAGQYETVLGVSGADAVLTAIRHCWASLFSAHAVHYRMQHGVDASENPMAVGVIELVDARASGVAFSVHPVTGDPQRLVIESTFGWGETLVQGRVTPDHFEVARDDGRVLKRRVGTKNVVSAWSAEGNRIVERPMPAVLQSRSSLDDEAASSVARIVLQIEDLLGCSVDVEWVMPKGQGASPVIVQARPETVHRLTKAELGPPSPQSAFDPVAFALAQTFGMSKETLRP